MAVLFTAIALMAPAASQAKIHTVGSTAYCLTGTMADGTQTRSRSVANNFLPLGSKIKTTRPGPGGLRIFYVRDRIGHGSQLDFWTPTCSKAFQWGRRTISFRVLRYGR